MSNIRHLKAAKRRALANTYIPRAEDAESEGGGVYKYFSGFSGFFGLSGAR